MAMSTRRAVGIGGAIAILVVAAAVYAAVRARLHAATLVTAQAEVEAVVPAVSTALDGLAQEMATKAETAARLPAVGRLLGEITTQSDLEVLRATFADFESEAFFAPFAELGPHAFFLGANPVLVKQPDLESLLSPLAASAASAGRSTALIAYDGKVWVVGAGRSTDTTPQQQPLVVILMRELSSQGLEPVATAVASTLLVVGEGKFDQGVFAGDQRLKGGVVSFARRESSEPGCCARKVLHPGVEVVVLQAVAPKLASAEGLVTRSAIGIFSVAGALAVMLLVFGLRSAPGPVPTLDHELLRETTEQLKQSQEQLQRLSLQLRATGNTPAYTPGADVGFSATQASVQTSRYEVVAPLGEGGMARVSVAVARGAEGFKRTFVLKRLRPELAGNQEVVNQFIDEARLGASLVHSNIVPVFDFGRDEEGYFLAQEFIVGRDVDALLQGFKAELREQHQPERGLPPPLAVLIATEGLKALGYAHTKKSETGKPLGLVHRDVSPNNLMVSARGEVKLLDFGIVKSDDRLTRTQAGTVKGNLFYMSPEQARALEVDARSDIFSMGMVLFTMLTGTTLYSGDNVYELMTRAANGPNGDDLMRVEQGCGALAPLIVQALSNDPTQRFSTANAFAEALSAAVRPGAQAELHQMMDRLFASHFAQEQQRFGVTL